MPERCHRGIFPLPPDHPLADREAPNYPRVVMPRRDVVLTWPAEQLRCAACLRELGWCGEKGDLDDDPDEAEKDNNTDDEVTS